jgi:hypothetical protein
LGSYPDFVFRHQAQRRLEVEAEWGAEGERPGPTHFRAVFEYQSEATQILLSESGFEIEGVFKWTGRRLPGNGLTIEMRYIKNGREEVKQFTSAEPVKFSWLVADPQERARAIQLFEEIGPVTTDGFVLSCLQRVEHLGPLRVCPRRSYPVSGQAPGSVGADGERTFDVLWAAHLSPEGRNREVFDAAGRWLKRLDIAAEFWLDPLGNSSLYRVMVTDPAVEIDVNFADIGFGASQVLPVVVQSLSAEPGSTILIEQPEIHLHPRAQSELGDLFIEAAQGNDRTFIIETHSEHILARICRRIAEGKPEWLTKDKVAIYYFKPTPGGTQIQEVTLNEKGQYVDFPPGFFEEDVEEAFEHLKAMSKRS